jgi:hypothetical protein
MSDMLQRLLGVEKTAASLVAEAEVQAAGITAQARLDSQKGHSDLLKKKAADNEAALAAERARLAAEREVRTREERERLARLPKGTEAFRKATLSLIERGKA